MDRRKSKTKDAIYQAFTSLMSEKDYNSITIQEIIDRANIGRSTFYTHFQTKDDLVRSLCSLLYDHIFESADHGKHTGAHSHEKLNETDKVSAVFCHILHHLEENDHQILTLLSCDSSRIFITFFKQEMNSLIQKEVDLKNKKLPEDFLVNHLSTTFLETIQWWLKNGKKESPQQLYEYFYESVKNLI